MTMNSPNDAATRSLKKLTMHVIDSADGYDEAAKVAKSGEIEQQFRALARERRELAREMQGRVAQLGGDPKEQGSVTAGAHRMFLNLRALFEDDTDAAIKEVEHGEARLLDAFRHELAELAKTGDGAAIASFVSDVERRVRMDHDRWSTLKHMIETVHHRRGKGDDDRSGAGLM